MRRKLLTFLKVLLGVWVAELALLIYFHKYGRNEYTRPMLIESHLDVPAPAAVGGDDRGFEQAKTAIVDAQFLTRGPNAGLEANALIGAQELEALIEAKPGRIPVWDTRLITETAARDLVAGEEFRAPDGVPIARIGDKLDFDKLLAMAVAYDTLEGEAAHLRMLVKGTGSIVGFDLTMVFAGVNFLMLAAFLYAVLWEPVTKLLDQRAQAVREDIESARGQREEAEALREEARAEIEKVREGADAVRSAARRKGEEERAEIVGEARDEARRTAERTKRAVETEIKKARAEAAGEVGGLSIQLAGKVLGRAVSPEDHERLVKEFILGLNEGLERPSGSTEGTGA